jgi:hypothetical protein
MTFSIKPSSVLVPRQKCRSTGGMYEEMYSILYDTIFQESGPTPKCRSTGGILIY